MPSLVDAQRNFVTTINDGPHALAPGMFAGNSERIILGLKAHANTISHARLVALEESFPRTREAMGHAEFNALSRDYVETAQARACDIAHIGCHFPQFLGAAAGDSPRTGTVPNYCDGERGTAPIQGQSLRSLVDLAAIEWAWLESYHAADAAPLHLTTVSAMAEPDLLSLPVRFHPATRLCRLYATPSPSLGQFDDAAAILIVRPDAEVRLLGLDMATLAVAQKCAEAVTISNLLALASEQGDETDPIGPVLTLIGAGALVAME